MEPCCSVCVMSTAVGGNQSSMCRPLMCWEPDVPLKVQRPAFTKSSQKTHSLGCNGYQTHRPQIMMPIHYFSLSFEVTLWSG